jgi:hypothetical protein
VRRFHQTGGTLPSTTTQPLAFPFGRYRGGLPSWTAVPAFDCEFFGMANVAQAWITDALADKGIAGTPDGHDEHS